MVIVLVLKNVAPLMDVLSNVLLQSCLKSQKSSGELLVIQDPQEIPVQMDVVEAEERMEGMEEGDPTVVLAPLERKDVVAHVDPQDHLDQLLVVKLDPPIL